MNRFPIVGWLLSFLLNLFLSIPFWFFWSVCGIGESFFSWLPEPFHSPGLLSVVGLFICIEIIRTVIFPRADWDEDRGKD